jgi:hypothetical protein
MYEDVLKLNMNRLNQTEPATFSILPCWAFFRDSVFIYFMKIRYSVRALKTGLNILKQWRVISFEVIFSNCIKTHGVRCMHVIAEGDSSVYAMQTL